MCRNVSLWDWPSSDSSPSSEPHYAAVLPYLELVISSSLASGTPVHAPKWRWGGGMPTLEACSPSGWHPPESCFGGLGCRRASRRLTPPVLLLLLLLRCRSRASSHSTSTWLQTIVDDYRCFQVTAGDYRRVEVTTGGCRPLRASTCDFRCRITMELVA